MFEWFLPPRAAKAAIPALAAVTLGGLGLLWHRNRGSITGWLRQNLPSFPGFRQTSSARS
jgi:hypothetical protein